MDVQKILQGRSHVPLTFRLLVVCAGSAEALREGLEARIGEGVPAALRPQPNIVATQGEEWVVPAGRSWGSLLASWRRWATDSPEL